MLHGVVQYFPDLAGFPKNMVSTHNAEKIDAIFLRKRFHHIIDSETLMPAEGFLSVSVVCKHSGQGDALSTALFCMPLEEGLALVESLPDAEAFWVLPDGTTKQSRGFSAYMSQP